jgi:hypothetical protein
MKIYGEKDPFNDTESEVEEVKPLDQIKEEEEYDSEDEKEI